MMETLTIFEGPDGSGKTTAARAYAVSIDAIYVHFDACVDITDNNLARVYSRALEPLFVDHHHVVFDRSWISEIPYGKVFWGGRNRLDNDTVNVLEFMTFGFHPIVVFCNPGLKTCLDNFRSRRIEEMLNSELQLAEVYSLYLKQKTSIPTVVYNYSKDGDIEPVITWARNHYYGGSQ